MNREEAINVIKGARKYLTVGNPIWNVKKVDEAFDMAIEALSADTVSREFYEDAVKANHGLAKELANLKKEFESAEVEFTDLPDIPRYYYEKVVGKMAHEINTLKEQLESAETHEIRTETHGVCSDLISREDAIEVVHKHFVDAFDDLPTATDEDGDVIYKDTKSVNELLKHNKAISKELKALPSADAVEVVRCGECKYKRLYDDGDTKYYYCALEDRPNRNWSVDDTDYCSWGERNEII